MNLAPPSAATGTAWAPRRTRALILAIAALAGALATIDGPQPTGDPLVDRLLVAVAVGLVTWLGAAALRWDAAVITLIAAVTSFSLLWTAVGVVVAIAGSAVPVPRERRSVVNAALIGVAMNIAARSQLEFFLGASAIIAIALAIYVGAVGFTRRSLTSRRVVVAVLGGCAAVAFVAMFSLGVFGYLAADDLRQGNDLTKVGLDALGDGDVAAARDAFADAATAFDAADDLLDTPLTAAAEYVPVLAQHHRVATDLAAEAADSARLLVEELQRIDLDALSVTDGRIDVDRVRALQPPLLAIDLRMEALQSSIAELDSQWLVPQVADRVDDLAADVARQRQRSGDALTVALAAPGLLGGDEPRTYFIGFTTPSEARGSGGFMGNWAEMTITDGQIEMTRFGRADDLNEAGAPATRRFRTDDDSGLDQWIARYGAFNLTSGPDGTTGSEPWKNINMSPDIAITGRAISALYPQSGGGELDGVFIMDVYTLARFLEFTGPIALPEGHTVDGEPFVTADNAARFLLNDQYQVTKVDTRADVLEDFSRSVVDTLLAGSLPPPTDLLDVLGPMVDQGRFTAWAARPDEQTVLEQIGMAGTLPVASDDDALAIVFNNAVGNKIDYYLGASATYDVDADASAGSATASLDLTMTNGAPDNGQPGYVIGNPIGLPVGTNRTWVSIFTRLPVTEVRLDGQVISTEPGTEAGYFVTSAFVVLPAGATSTLTFDMAGPLDVADGYTLTARTPPTVAPTPLTVDATWTDTDGTPYTPADTPTDADEDSRGDSSGVTTGNSSTVFADAGRHRLAIDASTGVGMPASG